VTIEIDLPSLTDIAAWIGALSGVAALAWQIVTWRKSPHKVVVSSAHAFFGYNDGTMSDPLIAVTARNVGNAPVTIVSWGVALGKQNAQVTSPHPGSTEIPHRLEPGSAADLHMLTSELEKHHKEFGIPYKKMRPWVRLGTGRTVFARKGISHTD
jgi:hypothetical protein